MFSSVFLDFLGLISQDRLGFALLERFSPDVQVAERVDGQSTELGCLEDVAGDLQSSSDVSFDESQI